MKKHEARSPAGSGYGGGRVTRIRADLRILSGMGLAAATMTLLLQPVYQSEMMEENLQDDPASADARRLAQYSGYNLAEGNAHTSSRR
jgi:hypothetical protein